MIYTHKHRLPAPTYKFHVRSAEPITFKTGSRKKAAKDAHNTPGNTDDLIDKLIASAASPFEEKDRGTLEGLSGAALKGLALAFDEPTEDDEPKDEPSKDDPAVEAMMSGMYGMASQLTGRHWSQTDSFKAHMRSSANTPSRDQLALRTHSSPVSQEIREAMLPPSTADAIRQLRSKR